MGTCQKPFPSIMPPNGELALLKPSAAAEARLGIIFSSRANIVFPERRWGSGRQSRSSAGEVLRHCLEIRIPLFLRRGLR